MKAKRRIGVGEILLAAAILLGCLGVGWLAIRTTAVETMPPGQPALAQIAPGDPDRVLDVAMVDFIVKRGQLDDGGYAAVGDAARAAPLDARPYLLLAVRHLVRNDRHPILAMLEAGRRLDPRQRWIRLMLLDQYLRANRYGEAAVEFLVLSRLVDSANNPILAELARMTIDPSTAGAMRQTLARYPDMEIGVLKQLALSGVSAQLVWKTASAAARAKAGEPNGWGEALVASAIQRHNAPLARKIWLAVYHIPPQAAAAFPYDGDLSGLAGAPPFNWTFLANEIGAVDRTKGSISISYYGRQPGELGNQLLVLPPGNYRLTFSIGGNKATDGGPGLAWTLNCDGQENPLLLDARAATSTGASQRIGADFAVPANCPAQWLRLVGNPGQFPTTMSATIQHISIQPRAGQP